jgi:toxin ParE1/3/4
MRRVVWSARGRELLDRDVLAYLEKLNEAAARKLQADIDRTIALLAQRPIGRPGRLSGTYEKSVTGQPYIIAYSFLPRDDGAADDLLILRVIHTARDWPSGRWPR